MPDFDDDEETTKGPPFWGIQIDADELNPDKDDRQRWTGYLEDIPQGGASLRFSNDDAENGYRQCRGPLSWVNSCRVDLDPEEDAVHFSVSIFDPRGGFGFTVRRLRGSGKGDADDNAGIIVIHTPYPGAGMQHAEVRQLHPGTVEVIHDANLPRIEDEAGLLRDVLAYYREGTRYGHESGGRLWDRVSEWEEARAAHAAAKPVRVAVHDDEEE